MNMIVACDINYGIGKNNKLPAWNIKGDLRRFKEITIGDGNNVIIMGRKTYESLPNFPLKERINIVVSKSLKPCDDVPNIAKSIEDAYNMALGFVKENNGEIWLIGGASLYDECIMKNYVKYVDITKVESVYNCDTYLGENSIKWLTQNEEKVNYRIL